MSYTKRFIRSYFAALGPVPISQAKYDEIVAKGVSAKMTKAAIALMMGSFEVRVSKIGGGLTTRSARAAAIGGVCPYFGQDYQTTEGIHHPPDCGKEHNGHFAVVGDAAKGTGFAGHMYWASKRPTLA